MILNLWKTPGIEPVTSGLTNVYKPAALQPEPQIPPLKDILPLSFSEIFTNDSSPACFWFTVSFLFISTSS